MAKNESYLRITQTKSAIGRIEPQKRTIKALGLGRISSSSVLPDNPAVRGMVASVAHLVRVEEAQKPVARKEKAQKPVAQKAEAKPAAQKEKAQKPAAARATVSKKAEAKPVAQKEKAQKAEAKTAPKKEAK